MANRDEQATAALAAADYLTVPEVAALLRLTPNTVYTLLSAGRMRHFRVGRSIRIRREDVDELAIRGRPATVGAEARKGQ